MVFGHFRRVAESSRTSWLMSSSTPMLTSKAATTTDNDPRRPLAPPGLDNMPAQFSVPTHTTYFAGYLDATGRHFTDEKRLCALSVALMPSQILDGLTILGFTPVANPIREFERDIADFLGADPKSRLAFYLIEYFTWYKEFSNTCVCEKLQVGGGHDVLRRIAYRLFVDDKYEVIFLAYWKDYGR